MNFVCSAGHVDESGGVRDDPKPAPRIRDKAVYELFHGINWSCLACSWDRPVEAHHVLSRGQGGDDVMNNLVPFCRSCHAAYHNGNQNPRRMLARFLRSEQGQDHVRYLHDKMDPVNGVFAVESFVQRLER